jgi:hypothetical protein
MNFETLSTIAPGLFDSGISIELQSSPGLGKSEWVEQMRAIMSQRDGFEWGLATCFLATMTPTDLMGYMVPRDREFGGKQVSVSAFTLPPWMQDRNGVPVTEFKRGFLFLDEFGQGEPETKRASAELLLNRRLGPWQLPDGWSIIAASNRSQDRSGVTKSFDFVINRRLQIEVTPDVTSWEVWANKNNIEPLFVAFAVSNPHIVFEGKVPDKQGPWCTPRSLVMLSRLIRATYPNGQIPTDPVVIELASGMIGEAAAQQLIAFVKLGHELPKFSDIIADPANAPLPKAPDARMLSIYELSSRVDAKTAKPVLQYVDRFPKEFAATFAKSTCQRIPELIMTDAFSNWATKNATIVSMMHAA